MVTDSLISHGRTFLPILLGGVFAVAALNSQVSMLDSTDKLEDFALGGMTSIYRATYSDAKIQCGSPNDGGPCLKALRGSNLGGNAVLWLGNSQLHAINQMREGDINAVEILHASIRPSGRYLLSFTYPNSSFQQQYVTFEYLASKVPLSTLIIPLVFDDTRETGLGEGYSLAFEDRDFRATLAQTEIGRALNKEFAYEGAGSAALSALNETTQESTEKYLGDLLATTWGVWEKRPELRAELTLGLYRLRNSVFNIDASSVRKKIPGRYLLNINALEAILASAKEKDIDVLAYIAPLRNDVKIPYEVNEYLDFKEDVSALLSDQEGIYLMDLESLVPAEEWGEKDSTDTGGTAEIDFMHFQAGGHKRLARAIESKLNEIERGYK